MARLGKRYGEGEVIFRQGETGDCMFVIQEGEVEAVADLSPRERRDDEQVAEAARIAVRRSLRESVGKRPVTRIHVARV